MYRSNPFCSTKTPGLNMWKQLWTRKRENPKTRKREESTCQTRKRRKRENGENKKTAKTGKTRKRRKPENAKTAKTTKTRKRPKVFLFSGFQFLVFWFSRFSRFSGFLVPLAAPFWPGRVFYVLSIYTVLWFVTVVCQLLYMRLAWHLFLTQPCSHD